MIFDIPENSFLAGMKAKEKIKNANKREIAIYYLLFLVALFSIIATVLTAVLLPIRYI